MTPCTAENCPLADLGTKALYTIKETAEFLTVSERTVWRMIGAGRLPIIRLTPGQNGVRRVPGAAIKALISGQPDQQWGLLSTG